jgi:hypothetical protein
VCIANNRYMNDVPCEELYRVPTHTHAPSHTFSHSLSLTHTHTHAQTHTLSHTHTHTHTFTSAIFMTWRALIPKHTYPHKHTHTPSHTLSLTYTHTHTFASAIFLMGRALIALSCSLYASYCSLVTGMSGWECLFSSSTNLCVLYVAHIYTHTRTRTLIYTHHIHTTPHTYIPHIHTTHTHTHTYHTYIPHIHTTHTYHTHTHTHIHIPVGQLFISSDAALVVRSVHDTLSFLLAQHVMAHGLWWGVV